jgi:anaerobic magnesium-protoporphyrin IX monomethyl ester cyclase
VVAAVRRSRASATPPPSSTADVPRVLLVDPYVARDDPMERKFVELYPSLGILSLAAYLRDAGQQVEVVDLTFERGVRPVDRRVRSFRPHVVGVHTKSLTHDRSIEIAGLVREQGAVPIAGGPDAATRPGVYLDAGFEAVANGEGEATLVEVAERVAQGRPLSGTPGLIVGPPGSRSAGPPRPFLRPLDRLPMPAWDLIDMEGYLGRWQRRTGERRMAVLTSRGCPFDCSWCSKPTFGRSFRQLSPERVLRELLLLKQRYRVDYVRFCDDVFGIQRAWLETLLDGMEAARLDVGFECLARVDLLKPDLLKRMRALGLARVYVGVESGSQKMLDLMNRGTRLAQVERAAQSLRDNGIRQFWFLMLGYPGETVEDIDATLRLFRRFSPEEYSVSIAVPVPGTRFYDSVREYLKVGGRPRRAGQGGKSLLYEGSYPESLYHWAQARFEWEAALSKVRGKIAPRILSGLSDAADRLDRTLVGPILLGPRSPSVRAPRSIRPAPGPTDRPSTGA